MGSTVALIRGINVGGRTRLPMSDLRDCLESIGLGNVRTYIQSGNVVFEGSKTHTPPERKIEQVIKSKFKLDVHVLVRTSQELSRIIEKFPFTAAEQEFSHVTFLSEKPDNIPRIEIDAVKSKGERFVIADTEVFLYCPNGYGKSKLSNGFFEKKLGVSATTRNWRTVITLLKMANR